MSVQEPNFFLGYDINNPAKRDELVQQLRTKIKEEGVMPKDALELTDEMMEYLYQLGYHFYNTGDFGKALDIFRHLMILDHKSFRYAYGMAACCHQLQNYTPAIMSYIAAFLNDSSNPSPLYFGADCFIELEDWEAAIGLCEKAIDVAGDNPQYASIKEASILLLKGLQYKITHPEERKAG